jgi:hypothetical protein
LKSAVKPGGGVALRSAAGSKTGACRARKRRRRREVLIGMIIEM